MSGSYVPQLGVTKLPPEYEQLPNYLVLDLDTELRGLHQALALSSGQYDYDPAEFVAEILMYLHPVWLDIECLMDFLNNTRSQFPEDADVLIPALDVLGKSLLHQLHVCRAYSSDGRLHYEALPRGKWVNAFTPVLRKHVELVSPAATAPS